MIGRKALKKAIEAGLDVSAMSVAELLGLDDKAASRYFHGFTDLDWLALLYEWEFWARPKQRRPDPMPYIWMLQTGRGFGKTRTCAETVRALVEEGTSRRIGILTPTAAVGRDVVVEGGSGILACSPPWFRPSYEPSKRRITWPNGAIATLFSSEDPEVIRGAEIDLLWIEEACALKNPDRSFSNAFFALRSGLNPIALISTTPKRRHVILQLVKRIAASQPGRVVITRGHTTENRSNLADSSLSMMLDTYGDTLLGQQELAGEELEDVDGAFWTESQLHALRVAAAPQLKKIVVGVDPAISDKKRSDENGIVVAGRGVDDELYVMADYSIHGGSLDWGRALYNACFDYKVGHIHVETVRGGNLVRRNIEMIWKTENESRAEAGQETLLIPQITEINSQELDKMGRIELFAGLWEQGKAHHVGDLTPKYPREGFNDDSLESEMCDWSPKESKYSPNRIDALIMATSLLYPERQQLVAPMSARVEANPAGMLPRAKARMRGMS